MLGGLGCTLAPRDSMKLRGATCQSLHSEGRLSMTRANTPVCERDQLNGQFIEVDRGAWHITRILDVSDLGRLEGIRRDIVVGIVVGRGRASITMPVSGRATVEGMRTLGRFRAVVFISNCYLRVRGRAQGRLSRQSEALSASGSHGLVLDRRTGYHGDGRLCRGRSWAEEGRASLERAEVRGGRRGGRRGQKDVRETWERRRCSGASRRWLKRSTRAAETEPFGGSQT